MILEPDIRRDLLRRFVDVALVATACFVVAAIVSGQARDAILSDTAILASLLGLRFLVQRDARGSIHLLLGLVLTTTTLFDTGFRGHAMLWLLHIPIALAIWILVESALGRALWLAAQGISIALVNHTSLAPRLGGLDGGGFAPWNGHIQLVVAAIASLLIVRFLSRLQQGALLEAQEQKRQTESASRAKDEFLSHMSHELRTPLNSIQGFADLSLQRDGLPVDLEENLRSIRKSADHLTHLVNDLLDLARLENGTVVLARAPFRPSPCIEEALSLLHPQAQEKDLALAWEGATSLPRVMGDRVRWKQILLNLVGNAIKYTPSGRVTVKAKWEERDPKHGILTVSVTDTGIGIASDDQPKVFDRFHRLGGFEAPSGTGLGLPISRILAQSMGVMKLRSRRTSTSWVIWSASCSRRSSLRAFSFRVVPSMEIARMRSAPLRNRSADCWNISKNFSSVGISLNIV